MRLELGRVFRRCLPGVLKLAKGLAGLSPEQIGKGVEAIHGLEQLKKKRPGPAAPIDPAAVEEQLQAWGDASKGEAWHEGEGSGRWSVWCLEPDAPARGPRPAGEHRLGVVEIRGARIQLRGALLGGPLRRKTVKRPADARAWLQQLLDGDLP